MSATHNPFDSEIDDRSDRSTPTDRDPMADESDRGAERSDEPDEPIVHPGTRYLLTAEFGFW
ncbi:hypothetical protein [Halalkalirubrum salinum]|uniref:hypothetical protein n=1 Tax=Halalkalirubrum salinum TaxID=2563889 RepID=UPI0010FB4140|nr:hypothetical protein [Halalkalirubrum salinum]